MPQFPILLYHSIGTSCAPAYRRWMVTPDRFAQQMAYLADNGFHPVSISQLAAMLRNGGAVPEKAVAVTFDDGLRDFLLALPILERFGFAASLFVVTGYVGKTGRWLAPLGEGERPMLLAEELKELAQRRIEIGAHTHTHPQLDVLPRAAATDEITRSKQVLEDLLATRVRAFAYPHGYGSKTTRSIVRRAGFTVACRVAHALTSPHEHPLALSRIVMTNEVEDNQLARMLTGSGLRIAPAVDRPTEFGWRIVRKVGHLLRVPT